MTGRISPRQFHDAAGVEDHRPDVDLRLGGVTVRLITVGHDWYGLSERDVELARQISALARELGAPADAEGNEVDVATWVVHD